MCPLNTSERPPPVPPNVAVSCGRPSKSRPSGTYGLPRISSSDGSQRSMCAPERPSRSASKVWRATSSRAGSPGSRAVVSNRISAEASSISSSRRAVMASQASASRGVRLMGLGAGGLGRGGAELLLLLAGIHLRRPPPEAARQVDEVHEAGSEPPEPDLERQLRQLGPEVDREREAEERDDGVLDDVPAGAPAAVDDVGLDDGEVDERERCERPERDHRRDGVQADEERGQA